jgi:hypothetical protein
LKLTSSMNYPESSRREYRFSGRKSSEDSILKITTIIKWLFIGQPLGETHFH